MPCSSSPEVVTSLSGPTSSVAKPSCTKERPVPVSMCEGDVRDGRRRHRPPAVDEDAGRSRSRPRPPRYEPRAPDGRGRTHGRSRIDGVEDGVVHLAPAGLAERLDVDADLRASCVVSSKEGRGDGILVGSRVDLLARAEEARLGRDGVRIHERGDLRQRVPFDLVQHERGRCRGSIPSRTA